MNKYLKYILLRGRSTVIDTTNRLKSRKAIFESIYKKGGWRNNESVSGSGSKVTSTKEIISFLPIIFKTHDIRSVLDIPCGDFNWMQHVPMEGIKYFGSDIVELLISYNQKKYSTENKSFFVADVTADALPTVDLILCRDCFVHFSNRDVVSGLRNILRSKSKYLLTTTFPEHRNKNVVTGNWRPLNLQEAPFNLPKPMSIFFEGYKEDNGQYCDKALGLWDIKELENYNNVSRIAGGMGI
jgi:2-polyprenyl-3-methyl-5-hydroxy-6-metoxy-1,4-benzoquinol methylase